jgi:hypothetical protein
MADLLIDMACNLINFRLPEANGFPIKAAKKSFFESSQGGFTRLALQAE